MNTLYVIRNQHREYLTRQREWARDGDPALLYRTPYRDEAVNLVFELSSRDVTLRAETVACHPDERQQPRLPEPEREPGPTGDSADRSAAG